MDAYEHGEKMDDDFGDTNDKCDCGCGGGRYSNPFESYVIDDMDLDSTQDENPLMVPPSQDSPKHILNALNDHCLTAAFERLHFRDLINVIKVCERFEVLGKDAFASTYKEIELNIDECDHNIMKDILCAFGTSIRSLSIVSNKNAVDGDLFNTIIRKCSTELKGLGLTEMNIQMDSPNLHLPFPKLEVLELKNCVGNLNVAHLIDDCPDLSEIYLEKNNLQGVSEMIGRQFKKLKTISLWQYDTDNVIDTNALERFIVCNPSLINLEISTDGIQRSDAIRLIGQNMLKLQQLYIFSPIDNVQHFQSDVEYIGQLRALKRLLLNFNGLKVAPLVNALATNNVPIELLTIPNGYVDDIAIQCISQLKNISGLYMHFVRGANEEHLIDLARKLTELEELTLFCVKNEDDENVVTVGALMEMLHHAKKLNNLLLELDYDADLIINTDEYNIMLDTIKNLPEKIGLHIDINSVKCQLNVPKEILRANSGIFSIKLTPI